MKHIESSNQAALALQAFKQCVGDNSAEKSSLNALIAKTPYYGFVDIEIDDILFSMFSNDDDFVARTYFWNGKNSYEGTSLRIWAALSKRATHIIDLGSYSGVYSLAAAKCNAKAKVFAIEALDRVYSRLLINKRANRAANLNCFNLAIADKTQKLELLIYAGEDILVSGSTAIVGVTDRLPVERKYVDAKSLDLFAEATSIKKVELIKIDVEGAEHLVFKGAHNLLKTSTPDIICELLPTSLIQEIHESLKELGYKYYRISESSLELVESSTPVASKTPPDYNVLMTVRQPSALSEALPFLSFKHCTSTPETK